MAGFQAPIDTIVLSGKGIADDGRFLQRILNCLHEFMTDDGWKFIYLRWIAPTTTTIHFSKALNRSVTGSMNDLAFLAKVWLVEADLSPMDTAQKLNTVPMSALGYKNPRAAFMDLLACTPHGGEAHGFSGKQ